MTKRGKKRTGIQVGCLAVAGMATAVIMATEPAYAEAGEEQTACREMIEGYYGGDASGLDDILAETFAKQGVID